MFVLTPSHYKTTAFPLLFIATFGALVKFILCTLCNSKPKYTKLLNVGKISSGGIYYTHTPNGGEPSMGWLGSVLCRVSCGEWAVNFPDDLYT